MTTADPVTRAVDAAIASATIYPDADRAEKVGFGRAELAHVVRLYKADATRAKVEHYLDSRLSDLLDLGMRHQPTTPEGKAAWGASAEWRDAMAASWLSSKLRSLTEKTYTQDPDGNLTVAHERLISEEFL